MTKQRLETRLREHQDACERGMMEKSGVRQRTRGTTAEGGPALSDDTCKGVLQPGKRTGLHWWGDRKGGSNHHWLLTFDDIQRCTLTGVWKYDEVFTQFFTFTLMMTDTFSRNISKLFPISKLVSENSLYPILACPVWPMSWSCRMRLWQAANKSTVTEQLKNWLPQLTTNVKVRIGGQQIYRGFPWKENVGW